MEEAINEVEYLVEILTRHPLDSLRKIAKEEGLDYYRLKRLYDKYYGRNVTVNAIYNIKLLGLRSYVAFLSVPRDRLYPTALKMFKNPFVAYLTPAYGFKNGLFVTLHIPDDQRKKIAEMLSKYSDDFEYYEVRGYPYKGDDKFGKWDLSYDYAVLMDILKVDARTPTTEIAKILGKTRPTVKYMINRLVERNIIINFIPTIESNVYDRGVVGLTRKLDERVLERFKEYEILPGVLPGYGYILEWYFSSKEDLGSKILEFSSYVEKILIEYMGSPYDELNNEHHRDRFQRMVKKDGSGYRSILEF